MARNDMEIDIYSDFGRVAHVQSERFILFCMYGVGGGNQIPVIACAFFASIPFVLIPWKVI